MTNCIFCKIIAGEIPSKKVFEDENMIIIEDINPGAKIHYLLIPKLHYMDISDMAKNNPTLIGKCIQTFSGIASTLGLENGFRLITNNGENARQSVSHIHIHIMGGELLSDKMG